MSGRLYTSSVIIFAASLSACGGGGGSSGVQSIAPPPLAPTSLPSPMPDPVTVRSGENFYTAEYRDSSAAVGSNAIGAWQQGATGKGITIGFVDTGLVPTLSDFTGRLHASSRDFNGSRPMDDLWGHGTAVAGIAAAARGDAGMQGIAFEATILMAKADEGCPERCVFPVDAVVRGIDAARLAGARVINLSMGGDRNGDILDAVRRATDAGIIIVIGAGNSGAAPTGLAASLAAMAPDQVIIVGGLGASDPNGTINYEGPSIYTTLAASSQASFLSAPGWLNSATYFRGGGIDRLSGTSFAAPVVAGAVALLAQAFPMLTARQIVLLLYVSADDLGLLGTDATFGRGRLNIGRAFQPFGTARMANSLAPAPTSIGTLPSAAGDAARRGGLMATILDDFGRPFEFDLSSGMSALSVAGPLMRSLANGTRRKGSAIGSASVAYTVDNSGARPMTMETLELPGSAASQARLLAASVTVALYDGVSAAFGFGVHSAALRDELADPAPNGFMLSGTATATTGFDARARFASIVRKRLGRWHVSLSTEKGELSTFDRRRPQAGYTMVGVSLDRTDPRGSVSLGVSKITEEETVLGGKLDSLLGKPGSKTWLADAEMMRRLGSGWAVSAAYRRGWTDFASGRFRTDAFSFDLTKNNFLRNDDSLTLRFAQPMRVRSGALNVLLPAGWNFLSQTAGQEVRRMSLTPSGREIVGEFGYLRPLGPGSLSVHFYARRQANHVRGADLDLGTAVRTRLEF